VKPGVTNPSPSHHTLSQVSHTKTTFDDIKRFPNIAVEITKERMKPLVADPCLFSPTAPLCLIGPIGPLAHPLTPSCTPAKQMTPLLLIPGDCQTLPNRRYQGDTKETTVKPIIVDPCPPTAQL
jgi:hypothetical protein